MVTNDPDEGVSSVGNIAGYIAQRIQEGASQREALRDFRDAGGRVGNTAFRSQWGQVLDTLLRTPDQLALDPASLPGGADYGTWAMGRGGQYATQVVVQAIDEETGMLTSMQYTHITDAPHTPDEAMAAAMDEYGNDDNAAQYGQSVVGAFAIHVWQTVPYGS